MPPEGCREQTASASSGTRQARAGRVGSMETNKHVDINTERRGGYHGAPLLSVVVGGARREVEDGNKNSGLRYERIRLSRSPKAPSWQRPPGTRQGTNSALQRTQGT